MSRPIIPDRTQQEAITDVVESIALEETALSHLVNAEAEKLQAGAGMLGTGAITVGQLTLLQRITGRVLQSAAKMQMLLQFKFEAIRDLLGRVIAIHHNVATATAQADGTTVTSSDPAYYFTSDTQPAPSPAAGPASGPVIQAVVGPVDLGNLTDYLFFFDNGSVDANWQGATKGYIGDVAVNGLVASERTSGGVPYAGTIYTNAATLGAWQNIVNQNPTQASGVTGQVARINGLEADLISAFHQINALPATPGFESRSSTSLDGLNTQNGINEVFVINITSGLNFSSKINITGDAGDVYILRWDTDPLTPGYQGQVKPQSGGAIVPHGGLKATNFINVAGDINSSGGGSTPPPPYPQGPRYNDGQGPLIIGGSDFSGGGFFTGYWLTTGAPTTLDPGSGLLIGETSSLSNGIFVGGWYTLTTKFSMTSGTSGVHVSPNPATTGEPAIAVQKDVSPDNGATWYAADSPTGPTVLVGTNPQFRFTVTNTGDVTLTDVTITDDVFGPIATIPSLGIGESFTTVVVGTWAAGQHVNTATATGTGAGQTVTASNPAYWFGTEAAVTLLKEVSPDGGVTWFDANTPPGPVIAMGTNPEFRYTVTNTGNVTLTNIAVTDNVHGPIGTTPSLAPGAQFITIETEPWAPGQQTNVGIVTADFAGLTLTATDPANYFGLGEPDISVQKDVSPDNGATWYPADSPTGPAVPVGTNPQFRFVVTNTGTVTLTDVTVTDDVFGPIATIPSLDPGESFTTVVVGTWAAGQHVNTATATGTGNGQTVTDSNPAYWFGTEAAIHLLKEVSPDNGVTWFDANTPPGPFIAAGTNPRYRYTVTNTGTVTLTNIVVTDDVLGPIGAMPNLTPGGEFVVTVTAAWAPGQHTNVGTVTANFDGLTLIATDPANYFGLGEPAIDIQKFVSVDGGVTWLDADTPPGPFLPAGMQPHFLFVVTNTGGTPLTNIVITDSVYGPIGTVPILQPGASAQFEITG